MLKVHFLIGSHSPRSSNGPEKAHATSKCLILAKNTRFRRKRYFFRRKSNRFPRKNLPIPRLNSYRTTITGVPDGALAKK